MKTFLLLIPGFFLQAPTQLPADAGKTLYTEKALFLCVAFSPDKTTLAFGDSRGTVQLWDFIEGKKKYSFHIGRTDREMKPVLSLAFSPDGKTLATSSLDGRVDLWEVASGKLRLSCKGHVGFVSCVRTVRCCGLPRQTRPRPTTSNRIMSWAFTVATRF
jgi:WD40 repeat protein